MTGEPAAQVSKEALAAAWATAQLGTQDWNRFCERFAEEAYGTRGRFPSAADAAGRLAVRRELQGAQPGQLVYFRADHTNNGYGHVGIYVGGDEMVSATPTGVRRTSILTDAYYGPRFVGVADAPAEWQGRAATPDLVSGAQRIAAQAAAAAAGGGTDAMSGEPAAQGVGPGGVFGQYGPPAVPAVPAPAGPTNAKVVEFQRQIHAHQQQLDAALAAKAQAAAAFDAHARTDPFNTQPNMTASLQQRQRDAEEQVKHWRDALGKAQTSLAKAQDAAAATAARVPSAGSQYLNTDASDQFILARNADGTLKMKADGSGPETIANPNYRPPADSAATARAASGLYEAQAGYERARAGAEKTPAQVAAESAAAVAREQAQTAHYNAQAAVQQITAAHEQARQKAWAARVQPLIDQGASQQQIENAIVAASQEVKDYTDLLGRQLERQRVEEEARRNKADEALRAQQGQRETARLTSELGGQAVLGAESQVYGAPSMERANAVSARLAQNFPVQPGQEQDSLGQRVLRAMGFAPPPGGGTPPAAPTPTPTPTGTAVSGAPAAFRAPVPLATPDQQDTQLAPAA